jgi:excinuclease ABC subunit B
VELFAPRRGPRQVQPPWSFGVEVDGPHDALRIGVGAGGDVECLAFWSVDGVSIGAGQAPGNKKMSVCGSNLEIMAFATEYPVLAHSEHRPVDAVVRAGGRFEVVSEFEPAGDQPAAIADLEKRIEAGERDIVLLGATGTGKSATTAWLIEKLQRPTLVMAPNKTLAAQLANELRDMLPHNAVEYFVSYYDYYQPEAYIAQTDTYIEKDSSVNDDVERLRHSATSSLLSRRDVVVVASVSCIYGLGTPQSYLDRSVELKVGDEVPRDSLLRLLVDVQYSRNDMAFTRGSFRVRGDTVEIIPSYEELAVRIEYFGDEIEALYYMHPLTGDVVRKVDSLRVFPATHYVAGPERMALAISSIEQELEERLAELEGQGKLLEAQRLRMRTNYDVEMMKQVGFCSGIENYSRHIDGRGPGTAPATLIDYFPEDFLMVIDESHVTVPQIGGMYEGDMSRKRNLVDFGFRLPSAVDNRPLTWEEFANRIGQTVYLSATPGPYELSQSGGEFVEQVIRPTGLVDPKIVVKPTKGQIDDLIGEIRKRTERDERVLVTTLTKKMAEDLTDYLLETGIRVRYLHSEVDTLRRVELLRQLRLGEYDVLVGINLLREGLDLPEVSLVSILDADKEGFLRSARSLIQTIGRAARNVSGEVHMYADKITDSMREAIDETDRRRAKQVAYNTEHGLDPQPLRKKIADILDQVYREADDTETIEVGGSGRNASRGRRAQGEPGRAVSAGVYEGRDTKSMPRAELADLIKDMTAQMMAAARDLQFELAARIRDEIADLKKELRGMDAAGLK